MEHTTPIFVRFSSRREAEDFKSRLHKLSGVTAQVYLGRGGKYVARLSAVIPEEELKKALDGTMANVIK